MNKTTWGTVYHQSVVYVGVIMRAHLYIQLNGCIRVWFHTGDPRVAGVPEKGLD